MHTHGPAIVYMSWGIWVARCPVDGCHGVEHYGHPQGTGIVGGLTRDAFLCANCGTQSDAAWPENLDQIWELLKVRPVPDTRNWNPGEPLACLLAENYEHGIMSFNLRDLYVRNMLEGS